MRHVEHPAMDERPAVVDTDDDGTPVGEVRDAHVSADGERTRRRGERDAAPAPRTGHGPRAQLALPQVEVVHTLDVPDRTCPKCGGGLREMTGQYEESEEIDVVERSFRLVRHQRQKYTCRCGECIDTALGRRG